MNKEMFDLCSWAISTAKKAGADDCKATINKRRFVEVDYREKKPETIKEASTQRLSVNIYVNNRYSAQNTSDVRKDALEMFIKNAVNNTKLLEEDPYRRLPDPKYYEGRVEKELELFDSTHDKFTADERHEMVKVIENACLERGGDKVVSVTAGEYDDFYEDVVMTSNGFKGGRKTTQCWGGAQMTAQDEGERRPTGDYWVGCPMRKDLPDLQQIGKLAAERTLSLLGGKKINTATLPIVIENRNVARVLRGFIGGLYGRNIQQKRSFLADRKGEKIGSDLFTIVDDPFIVGGFGSRTYDGDGFATKKRTVLEKGVLKEFFVDWYYSRKLEWEPTTGGPSNLLIPPGKRSVEEIMKDLGRGIFISGFIGGNSNSTTGDFSVGIIGTLFEDGTLVQPVAEMNIADNHLEFWNKLVEVGNDPYIYSSWRMPSLVFKDVVVSGV
jgi:PmbA protein